MIVLIKNIYKEKLNKHFKINNALLNTKKVVEYFYYSVLFGIQLDKIIKT